MRFGDYFKTIKKHFKKRVSNEDLCMLLFDSIILPLDLKSLKGEMLSYSKSRISEFINGKAPIPKDISEGYNNSKVSDTIVDYFDSSIVPQLDNNVDDLCYQLLTLIGNDSSISPTSKSNLRMLATSKSLPMFLVQCFGYSLRNEDPSLFDNSPSTAVDKDHPAPQLSLGGIIDGTICEGKFAIENYELINQHSKLEIKNEIYTLFEKASNISLLPNNERTDLFGINSFKENVEISQNKRDYFNHVANLFDIDLPDGFFNLGNLKINKFAALYPGSRGGSLDGSNQEKKKYWLLKDLEKVIDKMMSLISIDNGFVGYKSIALALNNIGTTPDQDINVSITIPALSYVTIENILSLDNQILEELLYDHSDERFFYIKRTGAVLDYDKSIRNHNPFTSFHPSSPFSSNKTEQEMKDEYRAELEDIFPYFLDYNGDMLTLSFDYDEIIHNTSIAFPSVILLKEDIDSIDYSIRSRNLPGVIDGKLVINK